jgi:hypothetical protein
MTLILGLSKPEGIYLSVDYRLTDSLSGRIVDDAAPKCMTIRYAPQPGGVKALIAFTGAALLPGNVPTLRWIRETLRGEPDTPDQSMRLLHERLNRDFSTLRQPLIINVLAIHGEKRFFGGLTNVYLTPQTAPRPAFGYVMNELSDDTFFANGSGAAVAMAEPAFIKMTTLLAVRPRQPLDFMRLLSKVNRRVATIESSVSPFCRVSFINSDEKSQPQTQTFAEPGEDVPFGMEIILMGIDLTDFTKNFHEHSETVRAGNVEITTPLKSPSDDSLRRRP